MTRYPTYIVIRLLYTPEGNQYMYIYKMSYKNITINICSDYKAVRMIYHGKKCVVEVKKDQKI